jgi:hypothetical protein
MCALAEDGDDPLIEEAARSLSPRHLLNGLCLFSHQVSSISNSF